MYLNIIDGDINVNWYESDKKEQTYSWQCYLNQLQKKFPEA